MPLFESPVGLLDDRNKGVGPKWPTGWYDATPFGEPYEMKTGTGKKAIHTGADLNCDGDLDAHAPVYAMGDGKVTFADLFSETAWGNLVIIDHDVVDGKLLFSRYAHVERISMTILKKPGTIVHKGEQIARVGNGGAVLNFPYHLHFDISTSAILKREPGYWPGMDEKGIHDNFVDPLEWLQATHFLGRSASPQNVVSTLIPSGCEELVVMHDGLQVRKDHSVSAEVVQVLKLGAKVVVKKDGKGNTPDGLTWAQIGDGEFSGCWVTTAKADSNETFLSALPHS